MEIQCRSTVIITFPVDKLFNNSLNIRRVKLHYAKKNLPFKTGSCTLFQTQSSTLWADCKCRRM